MTPLYEAACVAEEALGENLVWLTDRLDQGVRQKDAETLRRLEQLTEAWRGLVVTLHAEASAAADRRNRIITAALAMRDTEELKALAHDLLDIYGLAQ